jgi:hypothetical protein
MPSKNGWLDVWLAGWLYGSMQCMHCITAFRSVWAAGWLLACLAFWMHWLWVHGHAG